MMNKKLILLFLFLANSFQSPGQKIVTEKGQADENLTNKYAEFIKTKTLNFNKDLSPALFTDYERLADSLWKLEISYLVTHYMFTVKELDNGNISSLPGQSITNDHQVPFIRYKLDKFPTGKYMLTIVQGHLN